MTACYDSQIGLTCTSFVWPFLQFSSLGQSETIGFKFCDGLAQKSPKGFRSRVNEKALLESFISTVIIKLTFKCVETLFSNDCY